MKHSWFQTFVVLCMSFFWAIPQSLKSMCRRFEHYVCSISIFRASDAEQSTERTNRMWRVLHGRCWLTGIFDLFHERFLAAKTRKSCYHEQQCRSLLHSSPIKTWRGKIVSKLALLHKDFSPVLCSSYTLYKTRNGSILYTILRTQERRKWFF